MSDHQTTTNDASASQRLVEVETEPAMRLLEIPIEAIAVNHNPRSEADMEGIRELRDSIAAVGLLQPLTVAELGEGAYELITGGRRLEAVRMLGRERVDCVLLTEDGPYMRRARALAENLARRAMNPIDEARELAALGNELGLEIEELAEIVGMSARTARARLELLKLPKSARGDLRAGRMTLKAAANLTEIAAASGDLANEIAERTAAGLSEPRALERDPGLLVADIAAEQEPPCFLVPFSEGTRLRLGEVHERATAAGVSFAEEERQAQWAKLAGDSRLIEVSGADLISARAYGGVLDYERDRFSTASFATDARWVAEWLADVAAERGLAVEEADPEGQAEPDEDADVKAERAEAARRREHARGINEGTGLRLRSRYEAQAEITLGQAEVLAAMLVEAYGRELAYGMRLVMSHWAHREVKEMRGGATRITERLPEIDEARELLVDYLGRAGSGAELVGRLFASVLAPLAADQRQLPPAQQRSFELPHAIGREETIFGRAPRAALEAIGEVVSEERFRELASAIGGDLEAEPVRDRRASRQRVAAEAGGRRDMPEPMFGRLGGAPEGELEEVRGGSRLERFASERASADAADSEGLVVPGAGATSVPSDGAEVVAGG